MNGITEAYTRLAWWEKATVHVYAWVSTLFCRDYDRAFEKMVNHFRVLSIHESSDLADTALKVSKAAFSYDDEDLEGIPDLELIDIEFHETTVDLVNFSFLPESIGRATHIVELDAREVRVKSVKCLSTLVNMVKLNLSCTNIVQLTGLDNLKKLRWLSLCHTQVDSIEELGALKDLEELYLDGTDIYDYSCLIHCQNLKILSLNQCSFKRVPEVLFSLPKGCTVIMWDNPLDSSEYKKLENSEGPVFDFKRDWKESVPPRKLVWHGLQKLDWEGINRKVESLDLADNQVNVPDDIEKFTNLRELDLSQNDLETIPTGLCSLEGLETLNLSSNQIYKIPSEIGCLKGIRDLDLSRNLFSSLPVEIGDLQNLESLNLVGFKDLELPYSLVNCQKLTRINLAGCEFQRLPEVLFNLSRGCVVVLKNCKISKRDRLKVQKYIDLHTGPRFLMSIREEEPEKFYTDETEGDIEEESHFNLDVTKISLREHGFRAIPKDLDKYTNLQEVNAHGLRIQTLGSLINCLNLTKLDLSVSALEVLPQAMKNLSKLKILDLSHMELRDISILSELPSLQELYCNQPYDSLDHVVSVVHRCKHLKILSLTHALSYWYDELFNLPAGCKVYLWNNRLSDAVKTRLREFNVQGEGPIFVLDQKDLVYEEEDGDIVMLSSKELRDWPIIPLDARFIDLSQNALISTPSLKNYTRLTTLDLKRNRLYGDIGSQIFEASLLETLDLSDNNIESLTPEIGNLKKLKSLNLGGNKIESLPAELGGLENLEFLNLSSNRFLFKEGKVGIPDTIVNCHKLLTLDLEMCDIEEIPDLLFKLPLSCRVKLSGNPLSYESRAKIIEWSLSHEGPKFVFP